MKIREKNKNKQGVSLMISYVLLIFITISLSIGVYVWLKDYAVITEKINCKEGTSLMIESYNINQTGGNKTFELSIKNNGLFNIGGFLITAGNNSKRIPMQPIWAKNQVQVYPGYFDFEPELGPGQRTNAEFSIGELDKLEIIQIQPYIFKENNIDKIFCEQALIKQAILINPGLIPGLISWWKFDGNAQDSKDGNNGKIQGNPVYVNGKVNQGLWLDGNDYVDFGNSTLFNENNITLSAWIYPKRVTNQQSILSRFPVGGGAGQFNFYIINSKLNFDIPWVKGNVVTGVTTLSSDQWYHAVYTRSGNVHTLYLNSIQENQKIDSAAFVMNGNVWAGAAQNPAAYFNGTIDEVTIYNKALSAGEVSQLYNLYSS